MRSACGVLAHSERLAPVSDTTLELEVLEVIFLLTPLPDCPDIDLQAASDVNRGVETLAVLPPVPPCRATRPTSVR